MNNKPQTENQKEKVRNWTKQRHAEYKENELAEILWKEAQSAAQQKHHSKTMTITEMLKKQGKDGKERSLHKQAEDIIKLFDLKY